jgi:hypothetical protein
MRGERGDRQPRLPELNRVFDPLQSQAGVPHEGWSGTPVKVQRTFVCSVLYTQGTGLNRGGILLRVTCHDFNGDAVYYSAQQDNDSRLAWTHDSSRSQNSTGGGIGNRVPK